MSLKFRVGEKCNKVMMKKCVWMDGSNVTNVINLYITVDLEPEPPMYRRYIPAVQAVEWKPVEASRIYS
jgi:hypothetical protein